MAKIGFGDKIIIYTRTTNDIVNIKYFDVFFDVAEFYKDKEPYFNIKFSMSDELKEYLEFINNTIDTYSEITVSINNKTIPYIKKGEKNV